MKFQNKSELENHVKKFCVDSQYGDLKSLEEKYATELKKIKSGHPILETAQPP